MSLGDYIRSFVNGKNRKMLCAAPLNNMLIDQQGNVRICCHNNNDFTIGKFPEQSMHDIWFGEIRRNMVQEMREGKVPQACLNCIQHGINSQSPDSKIKTSKSYPGASLRSYPQQIEFLLDNECNLSCIMCASNKSSTITASGFVEKPISFGDAFLNQIKPFLNKVQFTVFSGGEPFLIPFYQEIWAYMKRNNPTAGIYVQTNGTVLNSIIKERLHSYHIQLGVSVDALTPEIYEQIRRNSHFNVMFDNLQYFQEYSMAKGNHMTIMMTPMRLNALEVPKLLEYCNTHDSILSLSILNWPYSLAIWSLKAVEIESLLSAYRAIAGELSASTEIAERNNKVFLHFIEMLEGHLKTRRNTEANATAFEAGLFEEIANFKIEFLQQLEELRSVNPLFVESLMMYVKELQIEFQEQTKNIDFVFLIFKGKALTYFTNLFANESHEHRLAMGRHRMEELLFLEQNGCYEKLIIL